MKTSFISLAAFMLSCVNAGTVLWDGRFNEFTSATDLDKWSWGNQVGPYQWYIHGTQPTTRYVNLSPSYKNPADTLSNQGAKITIDSTALWNSNMWRTELIPQTRNNIATGRLYYHFSVKKTSTNSPKPGFEHQVVFFESHFTELKYGAPGSSDNKLHWYAGGQSRWSVEWQPDVWHNFVYDIDFSAGRVGLWHSTGANSLTQIVAPVSASTSSNSADFHVGVLRLPGNGGDTNPEDWYFSGVYVESGSLTTTIGSGTNPPVSSVTTSNPPTSTVQPPTSTQLPPTTTSTTAEPQPTATSPKWGQCGGIGWNGPTACVSGSTCTKLNDYYSQCI